MINDIVISPKDLRLAERLAFKCGMRPGLNGVNMLARAVVIRNDYNIPLKEICKLIGYTDNVLPKTVSREINYAIASCDALRNGITEQFGVDPGGYLTFGVVLAYLLLLYKEAKADGDE